VAAFNARDEQLFRKVLHPDVRIRRPLSDAGSSLPSYYGTYYGIDEFLDVMKEISETSADLRVSVRNIEEGQGGMVLVELLQTFGPEGEQEHQMTWVVDEIRDGLIVATATFTTEAEAREAFEKGI
jgi:hypothetical protein